MIRPMIPPMMPRAVLLLCLPLVAACDIEGLPGTEPPTIAEQCQRRVARAFDLDRDQVTVLQALSVPEGDLVTLRAAGVKETLRCTADVDGVIVELAKLPGTAAPAAAAAGSAGPGAVQAG